MSKEREIIKRLKESLRLEVAPVGISRVFKEKVPLSSGRVRICKAILEAASGESKVIGKSNNACFGSGWHLGFQGKAKSKLVTLAKKFVVEREKLFASYQALDNLISQMDEAPFQDNLAYLLEPFDKAKRKPEIVVFVVDPEAACRLLALATFVDGVMPKIKIGGPTCRLAIIYPLLTGNLNISFYDYTARKICSVPKDKLLVSAPYSKVLEMAQNLDSCSAGIAKIDYL